MRIQSMIIQSPKKRDDVKGQETDEKYPWRRINTYPEEAEIEMKSPSDENLAAEEKDLVRYDTMAK